MDLGAGTALLTSVLVVGCASAPISMSRAAFEPIASDSIDSIGSTGSSASLRGISVVDENVVWASGTNGTVLRTTDAGQTWTNIHPPAEMDFRDIHAFDAETAFVMSITQPAAILRTTNGGESWEEVYRSSDPDAFFDSFTFFDRERACLFGDPTDGTFLVLRTRDGGNSWNRVPAADLPAPLEGEAAFAASGTCVASTGDGHAWIGTGGHASRVLATEDGGATWRAAATPMHPGDRDTSTTGIYSIAFRDARHGVIVGGDYTKPDAIERNAAVTDDGGLTWTLASEAPHGYRSAVAYVPGREHTLVAVGRAGSDYSEDGGRTWHSLGDVGYYALGFAPASSRAAKSRKWATGWAVGSEGRIARLAIR